MFFLRSNSGELINMDILEATKKQYISDLINIVEKALESSSNLVVFLEAGHFDPRFGITDFSTISMRDALDFAKGLIKRFDKKIKIVLGILIDDLGLECSETSCTISPSPTKSALEDDKILPKELDELLHSYFFVKRDRLLISSEKTCKNRGLLRLKKLLKSESYENVISVDARDATKTKVTFTDEEQNEILLAEYSMAIWKAKCPTIMGQHYIDCFIKLQQRFVLNQKMMIIDWAEMLDYSKVTAGSQAAMKVFIPNNLEKLDLEIVNIFFGDDVGDIYEIKQFCNHVPALKL